MKDKNGVEINVGDIVEYRSQEFPLTTGKVTEVMDNAIKALWQDTQRVEFVCTPKLVEVIKPAASIPAERSIGFTQEDEAMLQMLLKRKKDHEAKRSSIMHQFQLMVNCIHGQVTYADALAYLKVKSNAEQVIRSIKAYHEIN